MKFKYTLVLSVLLIFVLLLCPVVSGLTINGTVDASGTTSTETFAHHNPGGYDATSTSFGTLAFVGMQYTRSLKTLIVDLDAVPNYWGGAPIDSASTYYTAHLDTANGQTLWTGLIGYQRTFDPITGTPTPGYFWLTFNDDFDNSIVGITGNHVICLTYSSSVIGEIRYHTHDTEEFLSNGQITWGSSNHPITGTNELSSTFNFHNTYSATNATGLGIQGSVTKVVNGFTYNSRVSVYDDITKALLANEATAGGTTFNYNVYAPNGILLSIKDIEGTVYNKSLFSIFAPPAPGPTPTVAPYNVTVIPPSLPINIFATEIINGTAGDLANLTAIYVQDATSNIAPQLNASTGYYGVSYRKNAAGHWQYYAVGTGYTGDLGISTPNNLKYDFQSSGNHIIQTDLVDVDNNEYDFINNVTVTGNVGLSRLSIYPTDYISGAVIYGSQVDVKNSQNVWANRTILSISDCVFSLSTGWYWYTIYAPAGSDYSANNQGALNTLLLNNGDDVIRTEWLIPNLTPINATQTIMVIGVRGEPNLQPINYASLSILSIPFTTTSAPSGVAKFNLTRNQIYSMTVSAQGFSPSTQSFTAIGDVDSFDVVLSPIGAPTYAPTPVATTPLPIHTVTTAPTLSVPTTANGTYTGFWGPGFNMFAAMGASASELGILMAALFVAFGFIIGGAGAGTIIPGSPFSVGGAEAGAAVGFVLACAFGFIGIIWVIVIVLIGVFVMVIFR